MRDAPHLLNSSTLIYFGEWSNAGFSEIAHRHLTADTDEAMPVPYKNIDNISKVMIEMYHDTVKSSQLYY